MKCNELGKGRLNRRSDTSARRNKQEDRLRIEKRQRIHPKADDVNVDGVGEDGDDGCVVCVCAGCDAGVVVAKAGSGEWGFGRLE